MLGKNNKNHSSSDLEIDSDKEDHCDKLRCSPETQLSFCVRLSFYQELTAAPTGTTGVTAGILMPLSLLAQNLDKIHGILKLKFNYNLSKAGYKLYIFNATNPRNKIIAAYLQFGQAYANGPIIVYLFSGPSKNINGLLFEGTISNDEIINTSVGDMSVINSVASLYAAILSGSVYVNVASVMFPNGIIRGQI